MNTSNERSMLSQLFPTMDEDLITDVYQQCGNYKEAYAFLVVLNIMMKKTPKRIIFQNILCHQIRCKFDLGRNQPLRVIFKM